jgi:hypothetical protein
MTVSNIERRVAYTGNGATKTFAVPFQFFELSVYVDGVLKTYGPDYSISQTTSGMDGFVAFGVAPASLKSVVIIGDTAQVQSTDLVDNDSAPAETYEAALDRLTMIAQETSAASRRAIRAPLFAADIPAMDFKANPDAFLVTGADGVPKLSPLYGSGSPLGPIVSQAQASADAAVQAASNAFTSATNAATSEDHAAASASAANGSALAAASSAASVNIPTSLAGQSLKVLRVKADESAYELAGGGGGVTDYNDLTNKPTLGTAAAHSETDFATAAQGAKADSALQSFNVAATIHAATGKSTPVDADELGIVDSAASNVLKKLTWANFKTAVKSYLDTIYQAKFAYTPREVLTANRTYYVRADGNNSNTGLANTSGGAFLTIQKAIDTVATLDTNGKNVTIQAAAGTYTAALILPYVIGAKLGSLQIIGDTTTPSNCLISCTSVFAAIQSAGCGNGWYVRGFKIQTTTTGYCVYVGDQLSTISLGENEYGAVPSGYSHIASRYGGRVQILTGYTISGGANNHLLTNEAGILTLGGTFTVTLTGTPAFSSAFVGASGLSVIEFGSTTWNGSATGSRYNASQNSIINTFGQSASWLPGSTAGSSTGGIYA